MNGSMALQPTLTDIYQLRCFIEIPLLTETGRPWNFQERIDRDTKNRGYAREHAESLWKEDRNGYERFVLPTKERADVVYEVEQGYAMKLAQARPWVRKLI